MLCATYTFHQINKIWVIRIQVICQYRTKYSILNINWVFIKHKNISSTKTHDGEIFMHLTIINLCSLWWIWILQKTQNCKETKCTKNIVTFLFNNDLDMHFTKLSLCNLNFTIILREPRQNAKQSNLFNCIVIIYSIQDKRVPVMRHS